MSSFKKLNNLTGWIVFIIATLVYTLTIEPTASFWDPGEFIAVSYKLQVPHPPGAPFFLLVNRMFSMLALGDVEQIAWWINFSSAIFSGATILFMFWSITMLGLKLWKIKDTFQNDGQKYAIIGGGLVGSLAYAFTDSFWFSAVEAEVYAMSSFFTAWVIWAFLKWDRIEDEETEQRWLILIAYMMGLSIGVHLLNLVTIPALGLLYYFKKYNPTVKGGIIALLVSGLILIIINNGVITGFPSIVGSMEVLFVNSFGLPFSSGMITFIIVALGLLIYGIRWSYKSGRPLINTALLCFAFILIGYSSYTIVVIRSGYDTPIDENDPGSVMGFISYLKREQYGERPLLYGQYFTADVIDQKLGAPVYYRDEGSYEIADYRLKNIYDPEESTILPRAWSTNPRHAEIYRNMLGLPEGRTPSFMDNLKFMFQHQMNHMYWRYFMWNFSGRSSDIQDAGWLSPLDSNKNLPELLANNKARNQYFMIPLILGIFGLLFQYKEDFNSFLFTLMLFLMMGIVLILYLNSPPVEPRERDYIYVGSFYAFAFWIGLGVMAIYHYVSNAIKSKKMAAMLVTAACMSAPIVLIAQNWDDHNRSNRYFSVDSAKNMLAGVAPNGILFTGGDNDTFPLWYAQEVEGFRTDVRVVVLSYFNTDWYIDQMTKQVYESEPFPFTLEKKNYRTGTNDYLQLLESSNENIKRGINVKSYVNLIKSESQNLRFPTQSGRELYIIPSKNFYLDIDTTAVKASGIIPENLEPFITSRMEWSLNGSSMDKASLMILDLIANGNWERPIYFNNTSLATINYNLKDYVVQEGTVYRLLPVKKPASYPLDNLIDTEKMYDMVMNQFSFRGLDDPNTYNSQDYRFFVLNHRSAFNELASALYQQDEEEKARDVIFKSLSAMPDEGVPYDFSGLQTVDMLLKLNEVDKAIEMAEILARRADEMMAYMIEQDREIGNELRINLVTLMNLQRVMRNYDQEELAIKYDNMLNRHYGATGVQRILR